MCGFAGYKNLHNQPMDTSLFDVLSKTLVHRGPDDEGSWISPDQSAALVARRLSIRDISAAGHQPMVDESGRIALVFNGEIYNYQQLRAELESHGYQFNSTCDTQLIVYAYKKWGIDFLKKINGMFAICIYDGVTQQMFLIRDRIGVKPLYFSLQGGILSFASEIKALWQMPWITRQISSRGVYHYLTYLATPAPMTIFQEIYKLPAGYYAQLDAQNNVSFHQWYDAINNQVELAHTKESHYIKDIAALLATSVHDRTQADVPVGALLSGGLDSSMVVALMAQQHTNLKTFTVAFENDPSDERSWARKVAHKFNADHHELIISDDEAFSFLNTMVYHQDEPLGDSVCVPLYFISKMARDAGVKVLQIGEGADELFCGYPMYLEYMKLNRYWHNTQHYIPKIIKQGMYYAAKPLYANLNRQDLIKSWADGRPLFWGGVRLFSELFKKELCIANTFDAVDPIVQKIMPGFEQLHDSYDVMDYYRTKLYKKMPQADFYAMMTYLELKHRLPELILTRTDKMTMAVSVEGRVPFLDYRLVEYMLKVPMKYKYYKGQTKYLLKKVAESLLPREIIYRQKIGFSSPVVGWYAHNTVFTSHLQDMLAGNCVLHEMIDTKKVSELLSSHANTQAHAYQLWALQNLYSLELQ